jgi:F0F1-type ATP synthase assembly protein I
MAALTMTAHRPAVVTAAPMAGVVMVSPVMAPRSLSRQIRDRMISQLRRVMASAIPIQTLNSALLLSPVLGNSIVAVFTCMFIGYDFWEEGNRQLLRDWYTGIRRKRITLLKD